MNQQRILLVVVMMFGVSHLATAQEMTAEQKQRVDERFRFLQRNFTNFAPVKLIPPAPESQTAIQSFQVEERVVGSFEGLTYTGVRFTLPDWLDGNLKWSFFHLNPASRKGEKVEVSWGIIPEQGAGFTHSVDRIDPDRVNDFWRRFPNTRRVYTHKVDRTNLQAGASYALFFAHYEATPPDVAFGITVDSERGRREFGSLNYISGRAGVPGVVQEMNLTKYIQENWTNFPMVRLVAPTNGNEAVFQDFKANDHVVGWFEGSYYCGLRFTVPEWMDGDLDFAFVHRYRNARELRGRPGYSWGITAQRDYFYGMGEVKRVPFKDLPGMHARYPFTEKGYTGQVDRRFFVPGETYVYWWSFWWSKDEGILPDMDVAFTVRSSRGRKEFGEITWR